MMPENLSVNQKPFRSLRYCNNNNKEEKTNLKTIFNAKQIKVSFFLAQCSSFVWFYAICWIVLLCWVYVCVSLFVYNSYSVILRARTSFFFIYIYLFVGFYLISLSSVCPVLLKTPLNDCLTCVYVAKMLLIVKWKWLFREYNPKYKTMIFQMREEKNLHNDNDFES